MPSAQQSDTRFPLRSLTVFGLGTLQLAVTTGAALGQFDSYPLQAAPKELARSDFNIDGHIDLVTASTDQVEVLINAGDGSFLASVAYPGGGSWLEVGDVDGDHAPDIVAAGSGSIKVFMNRGDGTFDDAALLDVPGTYKGLALGDVDADDDLDIGLLNESSPYHFELQWYQNDGTGAFSFAGSGRINAHDGTNKVRELVSGDFDLDGDADFACGSENGFYGKDGNYSTDVCILRNLDGGTTWEDHFVGIQWYRYDAGQMPTALQVGDMNNDGNPDISCIQVYNEDGPKLYGKMLTGNGQGGFSSKTIYTVGEKYDAYECEQPLIDIDGDGDLDLVASLTKSNGSVTALYGVLYYSPSGTYKTRQILRGDNLYNADMILSDVDDDARYDIVLASSGTTPQILVMRNTLVIDRPVLEQDDLVAGRHVQFRASGLVPGEKVWFVYSLDLPGPSLGISQFGGKTIDLVEPYVQIGSARADDAGNATQAIKIPGKTPLMTITTQVVVRRGEGGVDSVKSNFITAPILP
ncbi:MAG: VCBS repeat-containing protein [Planctomycetes bacterium]|nr:VCBS repeat-containing protein [Planctomycetota bacterium]NOG53392.1 VCBS repeat-containing protein [Planctomycetota bacterium]